MSRNQRNKILLSFQDFVHENFKTKHNKKTGETFGPFEFLRAIILSGEASSSDLDQMRDLIRKILPSKLHGKIRDSIDPRYIGAIGAAYQASIFARDPKILVDQEFVRASDLPTHEEL